MKVACSASSPGAVCSGNCWQIAARAARRAIGEPGSIRSRNGWVVWFAGGAELGRTALLRPATMLVREVPSSSDPRVVRDGHRATSPRILCTWKAAKLVVPANTDAML